MTAPRSAAAEVLETHVSTVILLGDRAYKFLKPLRTPFLDYATPEARRRAAERELHLNRRLARDVYLGVVPVEEDPDGRGGRLTDAILVMRRMPRERRLSVLLDGERAEESLVAVARRLAVFHATAERGPEVDDAARPVAIRRLWHDNLDEMAGGMDGVFRPEDLAEVRRLADAYLDGRERLLEGRIAAGWSVDGHGDLQCEDIFLPDDGPRILDCLAFDDRLRFGDVLLDLAFLVMDVERLAGEAAAAVLVRSYDGFSGETHPPALLHHYVAYRALVRAKVEAIRAGQGVGSAAERARGMLRRCMDHLRRAEVRLVLVGGGPGTGKTTLAGELGRSEGWTVLSSDVVRRELDGEVDGASSGPRPGDPLDGGRYAPEAVDAVYRTLGERAGALLRSGESVVLDASWAEPARREIARRWADEAGARCVELRCRADEHVVTARVAQRLSERRGPSDVTPGLAVELGRRFREWPEAGEVDTGGPESEALRQAIEMVGPGPGRLAM